MTIEKIMEKIWPGLAGVAVLIAWLTNPTLEEHQAAARALIKQMRDNVCPTKDVVACGQVVYFDANRSGKITDNLIMSSYSVTLDGVPVLDCTGFFGRVYCGPAKK